MLINSRKSHFRSLFLEFACLVMPGGVELFATASPITLTTQTMNWISNNTGVNTNNSSGILTRVSEDSATTTVTVKDRNKNVIYAEIVTSDTINTIHGVYGSNLVSSVQSYEAWLGKPTEGIITFIGNGSWTEWKGGFTFQKNLWKNTNRRILWSVPLIPSGATLAQAAAGNYNIDYYKYAAQQLVSWRPQEPVLYIRVGWEFNGNWFPWSAIGQPENYIEAYRQLVFTFRSVSDRFRFDWCPNNGKQYIAPDLCYPGDDVVDLIGMDIYDETGSSGLGDPAARWNWELTRPFGINWHHSFALDHGKPMTYPEWGIGDKGGGDNPYMVNRMAEKFIEFNVVYECYWDSNAAYKGRLSNNQYPKSAATYLQYFGVQTPTGVDESNFALFEPVIYHNHAASGTIINIRGFGTNEPSVIQIFDLSGKVVFSQIISPENNTYQLNTSGLALRGVYLVQVKNSHKTLTRKLIMK